MPQSTLTFAPDGPRTEEFTDAVARWLAPFGTDGLLTVFVRHTSASILIQENADAEVQEDLNAFFERLVPPSDHPTMAYLRHTYEGPDDMPAHIKSALLPTSVAIPVAGGRMVLGTWQGLFFFEHRRRGRAREVVLHFTPDPAADAT